MVEAGVGVTAAAHPIRVLLADDDEGYLASLRVLIEQQPELQVVDTVTNGLAAIEAADRLQPDACVLDLHMPLLDGVTAAARLRRDHPSLCLIALTSDDDPRLHIAAGEAGADAVLQKGEMVDALVQRLGALRARTIL
jgi:DNA-binding NarL/FixJ family response regulator